MTESTFSLITMRFLRKRSLALAAVGIACLFCLTAGAALAQSSAPAVGVQLSAAPENSQANSATVATQGITFADALKRARANNPQLQAALTALGLAHEDLVQSRAALLPNVTYNMSAIYTQPTHSNDPNVTPQIFIANNGVHEYLAQGNVHQSLSLQNFADYSRASAAQAVARAKSEIALRGLAVTVAQAFY